MFVAKLLLGDVLKEGTPLSVNPLVIWAWAGLLINAINSIPAGELDGGRISFAIWGRKVCHSNFEKIKIKFMLIISLFVNDRTTSHTNCPSADLKVKLSEEKKWKRN